MPRSGHLPPELLETFITIADLDGDATRAAAHLDISQPTISKRLSALRRHTAAEDGVGWLILKGRRWHLTVAGERVRPVVADLVHRYTLMERFITEDRPGRTAVSLACGRQAASGLVRRAVRALLAQEPQVQVRISTPTGRTRIAGVAGGRFDFALTAEPVAQINKVAGRELYVQTLLEETLVLVADPTVRAPWAKIWREATEAGAVPTATLLQLPFLLPEPDAVRRRQFDAWCVAQTGRTADAVVEIGGWETVLEYAAAGLGVALVTTHAFAEYERERRTRLKSLPLPATFATPEPLRFVARKLHGRDEPLLSSSAAALHQFLVADLAAH